MLAKPGAPGTKPGTFGASKRIVPEKLKKVPKGSVQANNPNAAQGGSGLQKQMRLQPKTHVQRKRQLRQQSRPVPLFQVMLLGNRRDSGDSIGVGGEVLVVSHWAMRAKELRLALQLR